MHKKYVTTILLLFLLITVFAQQTPQQKLQQIFNRNSKSILVAAHRGDWRNTPENSVKSLTNCINKNIDICEFDLKKTKDGHIIIMHDKTIDRSTNGKGKAENYTLEEIKKFKLLGGTGHITKHSIPTLDEMLLAAKNKVIINLDKAYEYYPEVLAKLKQYNMIEQAIFNIYGLPYDSLVKQHGAIPSNLALQVIVNPKNPLIDSIINSYNKHKRTIVQLIFETDTAAILSTIPTLKKQYAIWFNSIWPEQSGGHDDDTAVEDEKPNEAWGWLVKKQPNIIQSDRPIELLKYLRKLKVHD